MATYSRIERETGYTADWRQTGSVRIAMTGERAAEFRELARVARSAGLEVEFLTAARLAELCPVLDGTQAEAEAERRYEDYYSLPGATFPARGES